ncbi:cyclase family protein [Variovorax sp. J22P240]|uniref:cyclase family protein n=1 Tax=unclassified Variovorax TaxID=663243 RepID=UPI002576BA44|nr:MULTISPECIES: cyclase family protein [unclassified Variovorax]MDM0002393.1 cyclase family protein [Variovorax sp. J22P240]MDM0053098.1 cyclase family protein [Variovorax sp. J22R115]
MKRIRMGLISAAALGLGLAATAQTSWYPSKWGPNDEIGAANYMTAATALQAAKLVKTGKVYSLGITVSTTTPAFPPRTCSIYIVQPGQTGTADGLGPTHTTYNDDILNCWTGIGTQLDGLGHIGVGDRYYNGAKWGEFATIGGLKKLGIEKIPPMVARGVMLDMAAHYGVEVVKEGTAFNQAEIDAVAKKQGVDIRQGDVVIFHTGWLSLIDKDPKRFGSVEPGLGREGARYLVSKGVVAVGADNWAVEVIPFEKDGDKEGGIFGVHQILLPMSGTYILENINTAELAKDKAYEFMFVLGQNKYQGAVQSMINPVAIR